MLLCFPLQHPATGDASVVRPAPLGPTTPPARPRGRSCQLLSAKQHFTADHVPRCDASCGSLAARVALGLAASVKKVMGKTSAYGKYKHSGCGM